MTFSDNVFHNSFNREAQSRKQDAVHAAMNHWFVRNRGVQHKSWPVMYEPSYHVDSLRRPPGIDETYWDTLTQAEKRWHEAPVKNQYGEDRRSLWQIEAALKARREIKNQTNDFFTQAVSPVDPFEEEYEGPSRAARKAHFRELAAGRTAEDLFTVSDDDNKQSVENRADQSNVVQGIRSRRDDHVLPFVAANPKWKQAGNW